MVVLAREAVGLTQTALAQEAGVSQAFISKIENGFDTPAPDLELRIASICNVPTGFFYQSEGVLGESLVDLYHKKRLTLPAKPLRKANAVANMCRNEAMRLMRTVEFDDLAHFPHFPIDEFGRPDEIATAVRAVWRIAPGPLPSLVGLIEATGTPVYLVDLEHDKLSAMSMPGPSGVHVIVLNRRLPPSAQRFALAHELGHLVMHTQLPGEEMEREADAFASELLMPASDIRRDITRLKFSMLGDLKAKWRVSFAALIYRANAIGAITPREYKNLNVQLSSLPNGRKREPGEFAEEVPQLLQHILNHFQNALEYSRRDLERLLLVNENRLLSQYYDQRERPRSLRPGTLHSVPRPDFT